MLYHFDAQFRRWFDLPAGWSEQLFNAQLIKPTGTTHQRQQPACMRWYRWIEGDGFVCRDRRHLQFDIDRRHLVGRNTLSLGLFTWTVASLAWPTTNTSPRGVLPSQERWFAAVHYSAAHDSAARDVLCSRYAVWPFIRPPSVCMH